MSFYRYAMSMVALAGFLFSGCGGGSSQPGPATGPFSNASLNGPYAFFLSGNGSPGFFAVAGSFSANGSGGLTGTMDINSSSGVFTNVSFTGTYNVVPNGQGSATLLSPVQNINLRLVVISISGNRVLLSSLDSNASGHGNADRQDATTFSTAGVNGQQAYSLLGIDAAGNPLATVGGFIANGAGAISSGLHDVNDNGVPTTNQALTGTYSVAAGNGGRGTMTLNTALGALHFAFYIVDSTHLKIVETERSPALAGESFRGTDGSITLPGCGPCIVVWTGVSGSAPFAAAGDYSLDDNGHITQGLFVVNDGGTITTLNFIGGAYSFAPQFRGAFTFTGSATESFAAYRAAPGVLMLEIDPGKVISGIAVNQALAGTPHLDLSFDGSYGFNLVGGSPGGQPEEIGQLTTQDPQQNGMGTVSGGGDLNQGGAVKTLLPVTGTFSMSKSAVGATIFQTSAGTQHFSLHAVGGTGPVMFVSTDANQVAVGIFEHQQ